MKKAMKKEVTLIGEAVREGRFQRWLSLIAGVSAVLSGIEVAYEHYRGGYSRRVMYTPVILSGAMTIAGVSGFAGGKAAKGLLRSTSIVTLADGLIGFYFHTRGIERKPGGWRLPLTNIVMGPPVCGPLLFGVAAYLGLTASFLRREEGGGMLPLPRPAHENHLVAKAGSPHEPITWTQDIREGRFQKHMAAATVCAAFLSGFEAWYSHYKNNFRYKAQWTPVILAPALMASALGAIQSRRVAHTWLPAISVLAIADGGVGCFYHGRGVLRRPGGLSKPLYNIVYGPPLFAPLLFAACGFLGLLASLLGRERK
jgi:hypothetical protein